MIHSHISSLTRARAVGLYIAKHTAVNDYAFLWHTASFIDLQKSKTSSSRDVGFRTLNFVFICMITQNTKFHRNLSARGRPNINVI
jgi:hypothetical protein